MSVLVVFLSLLFLVTGQVFSAVRITTSRFSTSNCNQWPVMEQDLSTVVNSRSELECASECAKMKCYCYKYLKQTSVCRLSSQGITMEADGWLCLPVPSPPHSPTSNCTSPFQSYHSICVTHISNNPFAFYGDMQKGCSRIGGELFKIQPSLPWKEELIRQYSSEFGLTTYAIQGQKSTLIGLSLVPLGWYNDDGSVATWSLLYGHDILVVDRGILSTSVALHVRGVICEQASAGVNLGF